MHDGASTTFHFVHPSGPATQCKDRDEVKELLQQLLPKFKKKVNKELEEKNRMLRENPGLLQLYKDLVNLRHKSVNTSCFWVRNKWNAFKWMRILVNMIHWKYNANNLFTYLKSEPNST